jgi:anaerobic selenocysteine-containing dehydrogenase
MVQRETDPLTDAGRHDILMSQQDADALGLRKGDRIRLTSSTGSYTGQVRIDRIKPGNLQVHWPEGNVLLSSQTIDPDSREPDYNAVVSLEKAP